MAAKYAETSIGYDTAFGLNEFQQPKLKSEIETLRDIVLFICYARPGQYPSLPQLGMDLQEMLYSHYDDISEADIKNQLIQNCNMLDVYITAGMLDVKKMKYNNQPSLIIYVEGTATYPTGYMSDRVGSTSKRYIGLSLDDLGSLIYNESEVN